MKLDTNITSLTPAIPTSTSLRITVPAGMSKKPGLLGGGRTERDMDKANNRWMAAARKAGG
ncbi:hypothetical protein CENSYa_1426 [Cenarchaeum symbiosum A]|uniref:Uncharacterized protein n=1 Tax=Cenarchaeum symbiosum (strain A) TaxID=414004 RepID=A0RXI1_CENSY|nr:hypothetical protein CENSYa_1426 [Cenarchaeum symbiosum A]